jgi:hypothetical protein
VKPPNKQRIIAMQEVANDSLRTFKTQVDGTEYVVETALAHLTLAATKFGALAHLGLEETQDLANCVNEFIRAEVERRIAERNRRIERN